ncbi:MAG: U32 family peptidase [Treponema sp.]|jgi:putative protease|nr:U32 family peptidase [Treponema sp.]
MAALKVELLAPAGSPEALDAAFGEGADGVYLGLKNFNARMRSANFAYSQFEGALRSARRMGRKLYVTLNTVFEQREADRIYQLLKYLASLGPDGVIVQDLGIVKMARDTFPSLKLHASTQMNVASVRGANLLSRQGVSRVVLSRELGFAEIRNIREQTNLEIEVFVHGALCVSVSGLCLFSSFLGGKSANRGMCTQACRRLYMASGADEDRRPPAAPGGAGYYFSPADLQLLEEVPALAAAGVNSFKIEGRMKSAEYVGTVVSAYRRVIDGLDGNIEESMAQGLAILRNDFARIKTKFYFERTAPPPAAELPGRSGSGVPWLNPVQDGGTGISLGTILKVKGGGDERRGLVSASAEIRPAPGDSVRLHRADDSDRRAHKLIFAEPAAGEAPEGGAWWISIPEGFGTGDSVYLTQTKAMTKRYAPVIPKDLGAFRRVPGRDKAPALELPFPKKNPFPEGIYASVSDIESLFVLQSVRPVRVMLAYNPKSAAALLSGKPLPFTPGELILVLDPWFPQEEEPPLAEQIPRLMELGYRQFTVNNLGHFALFRRSGAASAGAAEPLLIAGPWLYTFNRWAAAFVAGQGAAAAITPLENNRQNLERTLGSGGRSGTLVTVFAYPPLFRIRADLGNYGFKQFSGSRGEQFSLITRLWGSLVIPEKPFSIVDKIPFLREAGFRRFIVDLSGPPLKKKDYKDLMAAVKDAVPLRDISRFNWKNGFYTEEGKPETAASGFSVPRAR